MGELQWRHPPVEGVSMANAPDLTGDLKTLKVLYLRERNLRRRLQCELIKRTDPDAPTAQLGYMPLQAHRHPAPKGTIVVFASLAGGDDIDRLEFFGSLRDLPANRVFVVDFYQIWYQNGLIGLTADRRETIEFLTRYLDGFERPFTFLGSSSGAYAALLYGHALRADRILSFSAQTNITPKVWNRYGRFRADDMHFVRDDPFNDLKPLFEATPLAGQAHLYFGRRNVVDFRQNTRMEGLSNVTLMPQDLGQHNIARRLKNLGQLDTIIADIT